MAAHEVACDRAAGNKLGNRRACNSCVRIAEAFFIPLAHGANILLVFRCRKKVYDFRAVCADQRAGAVVCAEQINGQRGHAGHRAGALGKRAVGIHFWMFFLDRGENVVNLVQRVDLVYFVLKSDFIQIILGHNKARAVAERLRDRRDAVCLAICVGACTDVHGFAEFRDVRRVSGEIIVQRLQKTLIGPCLDALQQQHDQIEVIATGNLYGKLGNRVIGGHRPELDLNADLLCRDGVDGVLYFSQCGRCYASRQIGDDNVGNIAGPAGRFFGSGFVLSGRFCCRLLLSGSIRRFFSRRLRFGAGREAQKHHAGEQPCKEFFHVKPSFLFLPVFLHRLMKQV